MTATRAGFVAVAGETSAGKSSLVNALAGEKVAIVSGKPQSTRRPLNVILTEGGSQAILVDTPGYHAPKNRLGEVMMRAIDESLRGADRILLVAEAAPSPRLPEAAAKLFKLGKPVDLALSKADRAKGLSPAAVALPARLPFGRVFLTSARTGDGLPALKAHLLAAMPEGPFLYPEDDLTDATARHFVEEFVREVVCARTRDEIPYGVAVKVESFDESVAGEARVDAVIYCERESHKGILVGAGGAMIRDVGVASRRLLEDALGVRLHLALRVKVRKDWRKKEIYLRYFGYTREER